MRPLTLKERLQSDLDISHHLLKKYFSEFLSHTIKFAEACQLIDNGLRQADKRFDGNSKRSGSSAFH